MDGVNQRFDFRGAQPDLAALGRVHFIAIGGAGMSAVARLMLARGVAVSGSDAQDSATLQDLASEGATVWVGHDAAHLQGVDTVVISTAIREDNVELIAARRAGLPVLHRAQGLAAVMADVPRVAVAGANGKTTTTSMLTIALDAAGLDPSFAAGGVLADRGTNAHWRAGAPFVVEADESDGSFLVYRPDVAIVTNVQPDHLDFYGTFARVAQAYADFADTLSADGLLVACADDEGSAELAAGIAGRCRVLTYGRSAAADLRILDTVADGLSTHSSFIGPDGSARSLTLAVPGGHNVLNAAAAYLAAVEGLGASPEQVLAGLASFGGARRRFDVLGEVAGVTVVDDYAHNPAKVAAVVSTAAAIARARGGALRVVFQPHLYSRTADFAEGFGRALAGADDVLLLDVYGAREDPRPGVTSELLVRAVHDVAPDRPARVVTRDEAVAQLVAAARAGDVIVTIGAGDVTLLAPTILDGLGRR